MAVYLKSLIVTLVTLWGNLPISLHRGAPPARLHPG
jgi:hypothetical protein